MLEAQIPEGALQVAFGYDAARFGCHVASNDVIGSLHGVEGVVAADLNALHFFIEEAVANPVLPHCCRNRAIAFTLTAATLLLLSPQPVQLSFAVSQQEER
ncbi:MAG: hypothetical protein R2867_26280 [Caldilineaceae bacterium]